MASAVEGCRSILDRGNEQTGQMAQTDQQATSGLSLAVTESFSQAAGPL